MVKKNKMDGKDQNKGGFFSFGNKQKKSSSNKENTQPSMSQEERYKKILGEGKLSSKEMQALPGAKVRFPEFKTAMNQARENTLAAPFKRTHDAMSQGSSKAQQVMPAKKMKIEEREKPKGEKVSLMDRIRGGKSAKPKEKLSKEDKKEAKSAKKHQKNSRDELFIGVTGKKPKSKLKKKVDNIKGKLTSAFRKSPKSSIVEESNISPSQAKDRLKGSGFAAKLAKSQGKPSRSR